jgi:hypothetical protein
VRLVMCLGFGEVDGKDGKKRKAEMENREKGIG